MTTLQEPINSPFGYRSTALEVIQGIDLSGRHALVTGGYSGLGTETVRALAAAGAHIFVGARRPDKAAEDLADVEGAIDILPLDLSDPASINACINDIMYRTERLEIVIANAAIMACPLTYDFRGFESQFATNHLGHFQLIVGLWPLLVAAQNARVVMLSSSGHARGAPVISDLHFRSRPYDKWVAYGQAKTSNALFALWLDRLGAEAGVRAFAVDPGGIRTPLQRHLSMEEQIAMGWYDKDGNLNPHFKTPEQGAATSIWCATSPLLDGLGGVYCADCNIAKPWIEGQPPHLGVHPHACDAVLAEALWTQSEKLTGVALGSQ